MKHLLHVKDGQAAYSQSEGLLFMSMDGFQVYDLSDLPAETLAEIKDDPSKGLSSATEDRRLTDLET